MAAAKSTKSSDPRRASVRRSTKETQISVDLDLDTPGEYSVATGVAFLDHMLETLARHGHLGLKLEASGDTHIDDHHTVEDVGLTMGQALRESLGERRGIARFGHFEAPLDEALVAVTIDLSGRPFLVYNVEIDRERVGNFDVDLMEDFFQALATAGAMNVHVNLRYGRNPHHILEAMFKAAAKALAMAVAIDPRAAEVPSTKGTLTA